jgi:hypothetical protein
MSRIARNVLLAVTLAMAVPSTLFCAEADEFPVYLRDRGTGMPTSMFGSYIREGELLFYPFVEYYWDDNLEYKPEELGFGLDQDFRGKYRASEGLAFLSYGFKDWLAVEIEAAVIKATLEKAPNDPSTMPSKIEESGSGDIEGQIRVRWMRETEKRPDGFSYFEAVAPNQRDKVLIGTPDWELKFGSGLIKGFSWGTGTIRAAGEYSVESSSFSLGECAVEYLKRVSPLLRIELAVEGNQDEATFIAETQWHFSDQVYLKVNNGIGITSKATDWAPEVGLLFSFWGD